MLKMILIVLAAGLLSSGCATTGQNNDCLLFEPVYLSDTDFLTDETARQILKNNETGREVCGWKHANNQGE